MPYPSRSNKSAGGAGPYSGYSKNFRPVKKSLGTAAEDFVVKKVLGGGAKPTSMMAGGKSFPVKYEEAGVSGVVGAALGAGAKAAGRAAEKGLTQKVGSMIDKQTQDALKAAVRTPTKTGTAPKVKPVKPLRENYKTDSGHARALNSWEQKVRAWNRANPDDQVKIAVPKGKPSFGKIADAVSEDARKAAAFRTKGESETIRKGTQKARTEEGAKALEKQEATAASRKSVFDSKESTVVPRFKKETGDLPKGITKEEVKKFTSRAVEAKGKPRPPARAKKAAADLEESLKRGARMAEEGRVPGGDIPGVPSSGRIVKPSARPKAPAKTPKEADRVKVSEALKRDPKVKAKKAEIDKDIAEGKRTSLTDPTRRKPFDKATKKSIERNEKKNTPKQPKVKKPSAKKPGTDLVLASRQTPKAAERVAEPQTIVVRPVGDKFRKTTGPTVESGAPRPMKGTTDRREVVLRGTGSSVARTGNAAKTPAGKSSGFLKKAKKAVGVSAAVGAASGAAGLAINKAVKDKKTAIDESKKASARDAGKKPKFKSTQAYLDATTGSKPGVGQSKASEAARKEQNKNVDDGTVRMGKGGKYMRRYNAKTGRWNIVGATGATASKFLKARKKALKDRSKE